MIDTLKKIDAWLLPRNLNEQFSPYVWLIYLPLFFVPVIIFHQDPMDFVWTFLAVITFLGLYFHSHWVKSKLTIYHIVGIVLIGTLATFVTPTASTLFVYAAAFCSRLKPLKYAFAVLMGILLWITGISWIFDFVIYFYLPALTFTLIVGILNIYQYALHQNKQELVLSRKETQRLAQVAERERIARDLHDLIGHTFSVITIKADLAGRLLNKGQDKDLEKARGEIKQLQDISRAALSQVREVVSGYRTSDLLSELANAKNVFSSVDIHFDYQFENIDEQQIELDSASNKELAIVLRELVTNIIKHANATQVNATIKLNNGKIVLAMQDDGQGFNNSHHQGFGIKGIEERIQKLHGFVSIKSGGDFSGTLSEIGLPMATRDSSL
ncbi:sensor histidine kinase [Paraglaciecola sp. MB-3u-78]|uniref:sensor histidine kinase n=1 Tax=Paraglaciecola sp. MB-3u-78 TaxID=2058332 RepID=UPI000C339865|nr:sensor histidine kinase [Paraglaciecola sp. MB-3u-78]PKG98574.1 sensor histidine kinase [Paraglaciecola sp. MB-3u-78]